MMATTTLTRGHYSVMESTGSSRFPRTHQTLRQLWDSLDDAERQRRADLVGKSVDEVAELMSAPIPRIRILR